MEVSKKKMQLPPPQKHQVQTHAVYSLNIASEKREILATTQSC